MRKGLGIMVLVVCMAISLAGCASAPKQEAFRGPVESGTVNEEYVGNSDPALDAQYKQSDEEAAAYDAFTEEAKNSTAGDEVDAPKVY